MDTMTQKKIMKIGVGIIIVFFIILGIVWYFSHSFLIIDAKNATKIILYQNSIAKQEFTESDVFIVTEPGVYTVKASVSEQEKVLALIDAKGGGIHHVTLQPIGQQSSSQVLSSSFSTLTVDDSHLVYSIPSNPQLLTRLSSDGTGSALINGDEASLYAWSSPEFGVRLGTSLLEQEVISTLEQIDNGVMTQVNIPGNISKNPISAAVDDEKNIWAAVSNKLYLIPYSQSANLPIYTSDKTFSVMSASSKKAVIRTDNAVTGDARTVDISFISKDGSKVAGPTISYGASALGSPAGSLSPDNESLLLVYGGTAEIYSIKNKKSSIIPIDSDTYSAQWIDATHVLYATDSSVWLYNLSSRQSVPITSLGDSYSITSLVTSSDKLQVYIAATGKDTSDATFVAGITKDATLPLINTTDIANLSSYLPTSYPFFNCQVEFATWKKPFVLFEYEFSEDPRGLEENQTDCTSSIRQLFQKYNIDTSTYRFAQLY